jgi:O-antigen/teichoic acid export membrane protein
MVLGTAAIAASALGFQIISGRALGSEEFTPVGAAWTVVFFAFTVLMIPAEQFITRHLALNGGRWQPSRQGIAQLALTVAISTLGSAAFAAVTLDRFFSGDPLFVVAIAAAGASRAVLAFGRGFLAGRRRFVAYGAATGAEGAVLVPGAIAVALVSSSALAYVWLLAIAPLAVFLVRPFAKVEFDKVDTDDEQRASFLGSLVLATGASQVVIAGGPIFVGLIGGTSSEVSIYFVTFTLFRGPVTSSYNLIARLLPDFTELAARGEQRQLSVWAARLGAIGLLTTITFAIAGYVAGPTVVELLYGAEFAPTAGIAALGAGAVGAALVGLFISQVYVARGRTEQMAIIWVVAMVAAGIVLIVGTGDPLLRVARAFLAGELVATLLLAVVATGRTPRERQPA